MTSMKQKTMRPGPSEITYKTMKFLIMDRPTDSTIPALLETLFCLFDEMRSMLLQSGLRVLQELKKRNVKEVVRVCEATYSTELLEKEGIRVLDWPFDDGFPPPAKIVDDWFDLLRTRFKEDPESFVAVHCVAGLGRAPVLVALALIELGMKYEDAVELIRQKQFLTHYMNKNPLLCFIFGHVLYSRDGPTSLLKGHLKKRRGAINAKQLQYLEKYRPKSRLKIRNGHKQCIIQ